MSLDIGNVWLKYEHRHFMIYDAFTTTKNDYKLKYLSDSKVAMFKINEREDYFDRYPKY